MSLCLRSSCMRKCVPDLCFENSKNRVVWDTFRNDFVGRALGVARGVFFALAPGRGGGGGGLFSTFHAPAALAAHLRRALDGERANNCIEQFRHRREAHRLFTAHDGLIPNACEGPADLEVARLHSNA